MDFNGKRLLELCKTTQLLIANGRIGHDTGLGEYTFIGCNGRSVVDYLLLSRDYFDNVVNFQICAPTEFSDHSGLSFEIKCYLNEAENIANESHSSIKKLKWSCDKIEGFRQTLRENHMCYNEVSAMLDNSNTLDSVDQAVDKFSTLLFNDAFQHFGVTESNINRNNRTCYKQNEWYNDKCKTAKRNFMHANKLYKQNKTVENKQELTRCRSKLNKEKRRAQAIHKFEQGQHISRLAKTNAMSFWKSIKKHYKKKKKINPDATPSPNDFLNHFSEVFGSNINQSNTDPVKNDNATLINDLDIEISIEEVQKVVKNLKTQKSPGIDGLISEVFQSSIDILCPLLVKIFNVVFSTGCYPKSWSEGAITPIFKKGDTHDANNYRGITLINILSKTYSHILHNRLLAWAEEYEKINKCQFGFQPHKSTVDCIFLFHSIIAKTISQGHKLYCCFVDYRKAFDTVNRNFLWHKLIENNLSSRMVQSLKSMYQNVKTCIKVQNNYTTFFSSHAGLKQGDPLSAILFVLFINDLVEEVSLNTNQAAFSVQDINLFMLLYADDIVLFSKSPSELQKMLNNLHDYSQAWDLTVNTDKTQTMIFERGRPTTFEFRYGNTTLQAVDNFKYLGVTFYKNGNWNRTQKYIAEHGSFTLHNLLKVLSNIHLNIPEKIKLFDSLVGSVLSYAAEVWGYHPAPEIEKIHTRFCRHTLGVKRSTNLSALYCELGRKPLLIFRQLRMIKYWIKLRQTDDILLKHMYTMLMHDANNGITYNDMNWASHIKSLLDKLGLTYLWYLPSNRNISYPSIKRRIMLQYDQILLSNINESTRLSSYSKFKQTTEIESYLNIIKNKSFRISLSRFRLSSHKLEIEMGRYTGTERENRLCTQCNMHSVEDEYHFLLVCPKYIELRRKYLPRYYCHWPNTHKFVSIMSTKSTYLIKNLSKYIHFAQIRRNEIENQRI